MTELAIRWNDAEAWQKLVKASGAEKNASLLADADLPEALRAFSFEAIVSMYALRYPYMALYLLLSPQCGGGDWTNCQPERQNRPYQFASTAFHQTKPG